VLSFLVEIVGNSAKPPAPSGHYHGTNSGEEVCTVPRRSVTAVVHFLHNFAGPCADGEGAELLRRFAAEGDGAAFAAVVQTHGALVLSVCRRVLGNSHDAEDAFQATFLVLARKAAAGFRPRTLANWLHGVAYRTALRARTEAGRRRAREGRAARPLASEPATDAAWADVRLVLDEEIHGLPEKYRRPFVLCYLQGRTNEEAARDLGCPKGTVLSRLATAREWLRERLTRRGVTLSLGALAALVARDLQAAAGSQALASATARAGDGAFPGPAPPEVEALAAGALRAAAGAKLKTAAAVLLLTGLLALGGARSAHHGAQDEAQGPQANASPQPEPSREKPRTGGVPEPERNVDPLPVGAVKRLGWRIALKNQNHDRSPLAAFSPDGKLFAAADGPGVALWEVAGGKLLRRLRNPSPSLHTLGFGPGGTLLCLGHGSVHVWNVATGKLLRSFKVPESWDSAAFSPDGRLLAACSRVWDVAAGKQLWQIEGRYRDVSFSADGRWLLVSGIDQEGGVKGKWVGRLRVHAAATGKLLREHARTGEAFQFAVLSPDGKTVAAEGYTAPGGPRNRHFMRLLDLETGKELHRFPESDWPQIKPSFSRDGKYVTFVSADAPSQLWEVATGKPVRRLVTAQGLGFCTGVFAPGGKLFAGATRAGQVHFWDLTGGPDRYLTPGHLGAVGAVAFLPDGKSLVSGCGGEMLWWDVQTGKVKSSLKLPSPHVHRLVSPDGRHLLASDGGRVWIYDLARGPEAKPIKTGEVRCFSADGRTLVRNGPALPGFRSLPDRSKPGGESHPYALTPTGDIVVEWLRQSWDEPRARLDPPESDYAGLRLRDSATGEELATLKGHPAGAGPSRPAFTPDGRMMAGVVSSFATSDQRLVLWETRTGLERASFLPPGKGEVALAFSPDGRLLAFARHGGPVHLFDLVLGKEACRPLPVASRSLAFSPDGKLLASGNDDTTVLLWDVKRLTPAPAAVPLPVKERERCWADLAAADGERADAAVRRLLASPGPALALLRERLAWRDLTAEAARLIEALGSATFRVREKAGADLEALGDRARPFLGKALKDPKLSLEQRRRIEKVVSRLGAPFSSPAGVRLLRGMEVLERVGSREAVALMRQVGAGSADDPLTREARRTLRRLEKRRP
jgi:RNA polymerase sigma factor (sigma-70 family)